MSDIVERLHEMVNVGWGAIGHEAAAEIESLRVQVAALTKECDDLQYKCNNFQNKCRAAQAQIVQLREALETITDEENWGEDGCWESSSYPDEIAMEALAIPTDTAALDAAIRDSKASLLKALAAEHAITHKLRKAIDSASQIITFEGVPYYLLGIEDRDEALELPDGTAALDARLKEERERVAQMVLNGAFLHTDAPVAIWAREVAAAIREMK